MELDYSGLTYSAKIIKKNIFKSHQENSANEFETT